MSNEIIFDNVSKFYGEILGCNKVSLRLQPGITAMVGPNGSGKTTMMNLMTGLIQPTRGTVSVMGIKTNQPEKLFRKVGYCGSFDSFPNGVTGYDFINSFLAIHGYSKKEADEKTSRAIDRVGLVDAAHRKVAGYSKGMRQRIRLAQSIAHDPDVMILDEPLNGLDPMVRAEVIRLFRELVQEGRHLIVSSHILHEVDMMSDRVVFINAGYIVAKGTTGNVRDEMDEHPLQVMIRCDRPQELASLVFSADSVVEAQMHKDKQGLFIRTSNSDSFYTLLNRVVIDNGINIESVSPVDDDLNAVYHYLIEPDSAQNTAGGA